MQIQRVNSSKILVEMSEAAVLRKKLLERTYTQAIASHIASILDQLSIANTLELPGMSLVVLNAVLNDIISDRNTRGDDVMALQSMLHKVQVEVTCRYNEIMQQM